MTSLRGLLLTELHLQRVPMRVALITIGASLVAGVGAFYEGFPLYGIVGLALIPVLPLIAFEEIWKYKHYGFWAIFSVVLLLQLGHLGEHTAQITQLFIYKGDATKSHGVFGQLDVEYVHLVWDGLVWVGCLILAYRFRRNPWLWVTVAFASLHGVEHLSIGYSYLFDRNTYIHGDINGIFAKGGLIGSPLPRPYLHYVYNFVIVLPLALAFWDQTRVAYDEYLAKALPDLSKEELITTTQKLHRQVFAPGDVIIHQGEVAERFYIVSQGRVEVIDEQTPSGAVIVAELHPGQFFGEMGLLSGGVRCATVRAIEPTEVLALGRENFAQLVANSTGGSADLAYEMVHRRVELDRAEAGAPAGQRPS